jgi:hypothetical protein
MVNKQKSFLARVIEVPQELSALVTAWIVAGFLWLEAYLAGLLHVDLNGLVVAVGVALAALLTYAFKALLEKWVPVPLHPVANAILKWLAALLTGGAVFVKFLM